MSKFDGSHKYRLSWISKTLIKGKPFAVKFAVVETNDEQEVIKRVNHINSLADTFLPVSIERITPLQILNKTLISAENSFSVCYGIVERMGFGSQETIQEVLNEKRERQQFCGEDVEL